MMDDSVDRRLENAPDDAAISSSHGITTTTLPQPLRGEMEEGRAHQGSRTIQVGIDRDSMGAIHGHNPLDSGGTHSSSSTAGQQGQ